jgi:hypothetical protein
VKRSKDTGSWQSKPHAGRSSVIPPRKERVVLRDLSQNGLDDLRQVGTRNGVNKDTVSKIIKRNGLEGGKMARAPYLNPKNIGEGRIGHKRPKGRTGRKSSSQMRQFFKRI